MAFRFAPDYTLHFDLLNSHAPLLHAPLPVVGVAILLVTHFIRLLPILSRQGVLMRSLDFQGVLLKYLTISWALRVLVNLLSNSI